MAGKPRLASGEAQLAYDNVKALAPSVLAANQTLSDEPLSIFELPSDLVKPALEACRLFNTSIDALFYDVPALVDALRKRGETVAAPAAGAASKGRGQLDLGALKNPEGSLLVIDAKNAPYVKAFDDVTEFLAERDGAAKHVEIATIAGVGSSALGSAALAWDVSSAFRKPVLAIVPGYGVADVLLQALGGWYGFGMYDFFNTKSHLQTLLAAVAPRTAAIGRGLSASAPGNQRLPNGGPVFRTGCGSSDVLHAIMEEHPLKWLVGHSKGALSIANALRTLPSNRTEGLQIVTLGCPIAEDLPGAQYHQFLGSFDALGALNAWGNRPDDWVPADHSTNVALPLSMDARDLVDLSARY